MDEGAFSVLDAELRARCRDIDRIHLIWRPGAERNPRADHFSMGGLATEALVGKRITPRLGIKAGGIVYLYPFLDERAAVAPVGFAVVSF